MLFFLALVLPLASASARRLDFAATTTQSPQASFLGLSAAADATVERTIDVGFSCANRRLGYYADVVNDCKVFHICNPVNLPDGQQAVMQYSFFCPANSYFDQAAMTCVKEVSIPCVQSEKYYHVNQNLGVTELPDVRHQQQKQQAPIPTASPAVHHQQQFFQQQQPAYVQQQPAFVQQQPAFVQQQPAFVQQQPAFVQQPTYASSFPQQQVYTGQPSSFVQSLYPPQQSTPNVVRLG